MIVTKVIDVLQNFRLQFFFRNFSVCSVKMQGLWVDFHKARGLFGEILDCGLICKKLNIFFIKNIRAAGWFL